MLILQKISQNKTLAATINQIHYVVIIGEGLVGGALRDYLINTFNYKFFYNVKTPWTDKTLIEAHFNELKTFIFEKIFNSQKTELAAPSFLQLSFVWSAGKAGFAASFTDIDGEEKDFQSFLNLLTQINQERPAFVKMDLHFTSSAGGLFEGQSSVQEDSQPHPLRPYGILKLRQEQKITEWSQNKSYFHGVIYRLSTVYGRIRRGQRMGLISIMLQNGLHKKITPITGDLYTLRDYVHSMDIARMITSGMISSHKSHKSPSKNLQVLFGLSQKPTSIFEIKAIIEFHLKHKIYIQFNYTPGNAKDITFGKIQPPFEVQARDIRSGIKDVLTDWYGAHT